MIGCSSNQIYRLNLEEGKFNTCIETVENGTNAIEFNPFLELTVLGSDNGCIELVDLR